MLLFETTTTAIALLMAAICPSVGKSLFERVESGICYLAKRRSLSVLFVGGLSLALRAALLSIEPIPEPIVHDEFGYLLAADTFSHGRLTNPTPPLWEHFETFSILMKPTYQCFAQPAQGMMLALGKLLIGHPFWGVWLSCGLMCAGITWMLQGWLAPEWALLGGLLSVLRYGVFGYWANSYWGGAIGAIGGALVLGALPRIKESQQIQDALLMGLGLAILANSRPYEGFVFSLPVAVSLIAWLLGNKGPSLRVTLPRVVVPLTIVLALTVAGLGYYLWRVTGSPSRMPYQIEQQTYAVAPYLIWQPERPQPAYNNPVIKKMYVEEALTGYRVSRSAIGVLLKAYLLWSFFLGPVLTVPLLMLAFVLPRGLSISRIEGPTLFLVVAFITNSLGWTVESFYNPHYSAPATGLLLALILLSIKALRESGQRGKFLARAVPTICLLSFAARSMAVPAHFHMRAFYEFAWHEKGPETFGRGTAEKMLQMQPGKQLVVVRYEPNHEPFAEWVYNDYDIENAKVVWARELDSDKNTRLLEHFKGRQVWLLEADKSPPRLARCPGDSPQAGLCSEGAYARY